MTHGAKRVFKPMPLGEKQRVRFAVKWLLETCEKRSEHRMEERLAHEMIDIVQCTNPKENATLKRKFEVHELAMRNR